jgi:hypothetical protein
MTLLLVKLNPNREFSKEMDKEMACIVSSVHLHANAYENQMSLTSPNPRFIMRLSITWRNRTSREKRGFLSSISFTKKGFEENWNIKKDEIKTKQPNEQVK